MKYLIFAILLVTPGCFSAKVHDAAVKHEANLKVFIQHSQLKSGACNVCMDEHGIAIIHSAATWQKFADATQASATGLSEVTK